MIRVGIAGASGYSGGELIRYLLSHPEAELSLLTAHTQQGADVADSFPNLRELFSKTMEAGDWLRVGESCDVVFLALPHGVAMEAAPAILEAGAKVIDLGADFRLDDVAAYRRWYGLEHVAGELLPEAVYGLVEHGREAIAGARLVANPGCYPTAALLAVLPILPLLGEVETVIVDAKSGVSGAGRSGADTFFGEVNEDVRAYKVGEHRHTPELEQQLSGVGGPVRVFFTPHLIPMTRGLLATCYLRPQRFPSAAEIGGALDEAYGGEPFIRVLGDGLPRTKATLGSNFADVAVRLDRERNVVTALCALDNLGKGAAGQAIQNMNLLFGLDETVGLLSPPLFP